MTSKPSLSKRRRKTARSRVLLTTSQLPSRKSTPSSSSWSFSTRRLPTCSSVNSSESGSRLGGIRADRLGIEFGADHFQRPPPQLAGQLERLVATQADRSTTSPERVFFRASSKPAASTTRAPHPARRRRRAADLPAPAGVPLPITSTMQPPALGALLAAKWPI